MLFLPWHTRLIVCYTYVPVIVGMMVLGTY